MQLTEKQPTMKCCHQKRSTGLIKKISSWLCFKVFRSPGFLTFSCRHKALMNMISLFPKWAFYILLPPPPTHTHEGTSWKFFPSKGEIPVCKVDWKYIQNVDSWQYINRQIWHVNQYSKFNHNKHRKGFEDIKQIQ